MIVDDLWKGRKCLWWEKTRGRNADYIYDHGTRTTMKQGFGELGARPDVGMENIVQLDHSVIPF